MVPVGGHELTQVMMQLGVPVLTAVVGWLGGRIKGAAKERAERERQSDEERDMTRTIMRTLLYCRLSDMHRHYVVDGKPCPPAEKQEVEEVYQYYHDKLGGNGSGTALYTEIMAAHVA